MKVRYEVPIAVKATDKDARVARTVIGYSSGNFEIRETSASNMPVACVVSDDEDWPFKTLRYDTEFEGFYSELGELEPWMLSATSQCGPIGDAMDNIRRDVLEKHANKSKKELERIFDNPALAMMIVGRNRDAARNIREVRPRDFKEFDHVSCDRQVALFEEELEGCAVVDGVFVRGELRPLVVVSVSGIGIHREIVFDRSLADVVKGDGIGAVIAVFGLDDMESAIETANEAAETLKMRVLPNDTRVKIAMPGIFSVNQEQVANILTAHHIMGTLVSTAKALGPERTMLEMPMALVEAARGLSGAMRAARTPNLQAAIERCLSEGWNMPPVVGRIRPETEFVIRRWEERRVDLPLDPPKNFL